MRSRASTSWLIFSVLAFALGSPAALPRLAATQQPPPPQTFQTRSSGAEGFGIRSAADPSSRVSQMHKTLRARPAGLVL